MKHPIVVTGEPFDWQEGERYAARAIDQNGDVDWQAAFFADPGVMACPACNETLWREGQLVRCPTCGHEFDAPIHRARRMKVSR